MLEHLDEIPWADLEHAYGSATDVPGLLRQLLDTDPKVRSQTMWALYSNVFHQGTRYPVTPYVIPFLIELCANPKIPRRGELLFYWGHLITGYFNVRERPHWSDGKHVYCGGELEEIARYADYPYPAILHHIYQESLKGHKLLYTLLSSGEFDVRASAVWVLACLPTIAATSAPKLAVRARVEPSGWVRSAIAFALGELGASAPLKLMLEDDAPAVRCMAACELARIEPTETLIEPLLQFVSEPIEGYDAVPGAGGKSTGDAAFSISYLPIETQRKAIPAICDRLDQSRSFDTTPLVSTLLSAAFSKRDDALTEPTTLQRQVLARMVNTEELWSMGNLLWQFRSYGLSEDRQECARLIGIDVVDDLALKSLRSGLAFADIGYLEKGREEILKALELDPSIFERTPTPEEGWLLCAKAFAEVEPERAIAAYQHAISINSGVADRVNPTWHLADLLKERGIS